MRDLLFQKPQRISDDAANVYPRPQRLPPRWLDVCGLNDCHDKEAPRSHTSKGRSWPVVVHRHRDARKQAQ